MYRKILVPLDGSALAETAIPHATLLASATRAKLELIRITILRFHQQSGKGGFTVKEEADKEEAVSYLQEWQRRLESQGLEVSFRVMSGSVAESIIKYARQIQSDLIVMTTHGRTGTRLWAYGSVAYGVLRNAPCSVMVVRAPRGDAESGEHIDPER
ncbi:MAG: universal stress protein [Chloroflexota bacterium]|jgi:nucleotide-binding universal stress UspA family protein